MLNSFIRGTDPITTMGIGLEAINHKPSITSIMNQLIEKYHCGYAEIYADNEDNFSLSIMSKRLLKNVDGEIVQCNEPLLLFMISYERVWNLKDEKFFKLHWANSYDRWVHLNHGKERTSISFEICDNLLSTLLNFDFPYLKDKYIK